MEPVFIKWIVSALVIGVFFTDFILKIFNMNAALEKKEKQPSFSISWVSKEDYIKSIQYTLTKTRFDLFSLIFNTAVLLVILHSPLFSIMEIFFTDLTSYPMVNTLFMWGTLLIGWDILHLPFQLYFQFVIEQEFGFNKMTGRLYLADKIKSFLVSLVLMIPLAMALLFLYQKSGQLWWLWCFVLYFVYQMIVVIIYPVLIAPLFNKFSPLKDGPLKEKLYQLADATGFETSGIFVIDGSRRSGHSNAYFYGIGRSKRIVLFDTLLEELNEDQTAAVLAHEIGHYKKKHFLPKLITSVIGSAIAFFGISVLLNWAPFFQGFGFSTGNLGNLIIILFLFAGKFFYFLTPLGNAFSRRHEFQADEYARNAVGNGKDLADALLAMSSSNLSNLNPHPLYSKWYYSHPAIGERIAALLKDEENE